VGTNLSSGPTTVASQLSQPLGMGKRSLLRAYYNVIVGSKKHRFDDKFKPSLKAAP
jgi:hypothetical protein